MNAFGLQFASERGATAVIVALIFPALLLVGTFVIDVSNLWVHKRHLQSQADAAALAGAALVQPTVCDADKNAPGVEAEKFARGPLNPQVGGTPNSNIAFKLNSPNFDGQSNTDSTVKAGSPCDTMMVDVKLTEHGLGWWFQQIADVDINARARVAIRAISESANQLPAGVRLAQFSDVGFQFVDEATGNAVGLPHRLLDTDGDGLWEEALPIPTTITKRRLGVRIALSNNGSITCGATGVSCYQPDSLGGRGLSFIRGYEALDPGTGGKPRVHSAFFDTAASTCEDPYFPKVDDAACAVHLDADIKWNSHIEESEMGGTSPAVKAWAVVGNTDYEMKWTSGDRWETVNPIPVAQGTLSPIDVSMKWEQQTGEVNGETCKVNGNKCKDTFEDGNNDAELIQRIVPQSRDRSGPIELLQLWQDGTMPAHSFRMCDLTYLTCAPNLTVKLRLQGSDGVHQLHLGESPGSQNQAVDCDSGATLKEELISGCQTRYQLIKTGQTCLVDPAPGDQYRHCVDVATGDATGQLGDGLNTRFLGASWRTTGCTAVNNYPDYEPDDPRIVQVFVTSYDSFTAAGNDSVEIRGFAWMYVTGWRGPKNDRQNPCASVNGAHADDPAPEADDRASIWGRLIPHVGNSGDGAIGTSDCDFADKLKACTAMLVE